MRRICAAAIHLDGRRAEQRLGLAAISRCHRDCSSAELDVGRFASTQDLEDFSRRYPPWAGRVRREQGGGIPARAAAASFTSFTRTANLQTQATDRAPRTAQPGRSRRRCEQCWLAQSSRKRRARVRRDSHMPISTGPWSFLVLRTPAVRPYAGNGHATVAPRRRPADKARKACRAGHRRRRSSAASPAKPGHDPRRRGRITATMAAQLCPRRRCCTSRPGWKPGSPRWRRVGSRQRCSRP